MSTTRRTIPVPKQHRRPMRLVAIMSLTASLLCGCQHTPSPALLNVTSHPITIANAAAMIPASKSQTLFSQHDYAGGLIEYFMDVQSVFCHDDQCEIIELRLFWNPLGVYERYETLNKKDLTKFDHAPFTADDHAILHQLLADPQSQISRVQAKELLAAEIEKTTPGSPVYQFLWRNPEFAIDLDDQVDAASSPTPPDLKTLVVPGAAYTSVTLWNWANGEIPDHIRTITRNTASRHQLLDWLASDNSKQINFALDALTHRKFTDSETYNTILTLCQQNNTDWLRHAWPYLITANANNLPKRFKLYKTLLQALSPQHRIFLLEQLAQQKIIPQPWYPELTNILTPFETYYEAHLFLNLLTSRKIKNPHVIQNLATQLDHPDPFISRRIHTFLLTHNPPPNQSRP